MIKRSDGRFCEKWFKSDVRFKKNLTLDGK